MADRKPSLAELRRPGLSETLRGPKSPDACQACGVQPTDRMELTRWRECAPDDGPTDVRLFLCRKCSAALIQRHPRLYLAESPWLPCPGVMPCCATCARRTELTCEHPAQRRLGGPGLSVTWQPGPEGVMCGTSGCRDLRTAMPKGPPACEGYTDG